MSNTNSSSSISFGAVSITWLLTAVLVVLKLLGKITISWFWVVFPAAFSIGLSLLILGAILIIAFLVALAK